MADNKKTTAAAAPATDKKWVEVHADSERISLDACAKKGLEPVVTGWLVGVRRLKEEDENMSSLDCLELILTEPVKIANLEGDVYDLPVGTVTFVSATMRLAGLIDVALHPTEVYEVRIVPGKEKALPGGKRLKTYKVMRSEHPSPRSEIAPLSFASLPSQKAIFQARSMAPALPASLQD